MIAIIDYGNGNLSSVKNAFDFINADSKITSNAKEISESEKVVFPGVGSFGYMMKKLKEKNLENTIKEVITTGKPFLGICLGLQVLFEKSEESPGIKGLGIFEGKVVKFKNGKVPQIGWNNIISNNKEIMKNGFAYFVNSYYAAPEDSNVVLAKTDYFGEFASAIQRDNVIAVQFHPEKSGEFGLEFLKQWSKC